MTNRPLIIRILDSVIDWMLTKFMKTEGGSQ